MHRSDVAVGWICALPLENAASQAALDSMEPDTVLSGSSIFTLGIIGGHRVVIGCLPDGEYGTAAAANVANDMSRAFPSISINLVVGIAGGAPFLPERDIRLGDVVVSSCSGENGAVFQYDYGKAIQNQAFLNTRFLNQPPLLLREAVAQVRTKYERNGHQLNKDIEFILSNIGESRKKFYRRPHQESDRLYHSDIDHSVHCSGTVCSAEAEHWIEREPRIDHTDDPIIHYGLIASANQLVKDALLRDKLASERNVLCFEMESAGLMNHSPCLVIRGICDYSDSHKNKRWQRYAAVTAAAYARLLLRQIPPAEARAYLKKFEKL
ncbi:nucleoside phosphorylase domain-containing protein [Corynascus similis CBS 632.67]